MSPARLSIALLLAALLLMLTSAGASAGRAWEDSNESGEEIDAPLPPLPSKPLYRGYQPSTSTGYKSGRMQRFWRNYSRPRAEKGVKEVEPREYIDD
jgi:hypothetical protein